LLQPITNPVKQENNEEIKTKNYMRRA